jgi:hypothetical protein
MNHTPWNPIDFVIYDANDKMIVNCEGHEHTTYSEAVQTAAHIVKCVNERDELVCALREAVIALESLGAEGALLDGLRATLAKVQS